MREFEKRNSFKNSESLKSIVDMASNQEIINSLRRLDLNQYEAQAYLTLATLGEKTAGDLSEDAGLPRPRVYDVLSKLQEKGFVVVQPGRPVKYAAIPIEEAVKTLGKQKEQELLEKLEEFKEISNQISKKFKNINTAQRYGIEENVWTLKGRDAIYSKMAGMIAGAKNHVVISSTAEGILRKLKAHGKELEKASSRGAKIHFLSPIEQKQIMGLLGEKARISSFQKKSLPTRMLLADDEALIFLTEERAPNEEVGLWVRSPHLAATFRQALNIQENEKKE